MKILIITSLYPAYEGHSIMDVTYAIHYMAREWVASGNEVLVVRPWTYFPKVFEIAEHARVKKAWAKSEIFNLDGVRVFRCPLKRLPRTKESSRLINKTANAVRKHLLDEEFFPDVIVCEMISPHLFIGAVLKEQLGAPLGVGMHFSDIRFLSKRTNRGRFRRISPKVDFIAFRSEMLRRSYSDLLNNENPIEKTFVSWLGVDSLYGLCNNQITEKVDRVPQTILVASRLISLKNIDVLIEAFARVHSRGDLSLMILGDGPERRSLEFLAEKLGISDSVYFAGAVPRDRVLKYMEEAEIYAMVSSPETFGLVYLEAMSQGCVTIGSRGEGIDGVIVDGENGFLCTPGRVDELAEVLIKVLSLDRTEKERIVNNAIITARNLHYIKTSAEYLDKIKECVC